MRESWERFFFVFFFLGGGSFFFLGSGVVKGNANKVYRYFIVDIHTYIHTFFFFFFFEGGKVLQVVTFIGLIQLIFKTI